MIECVATVGPRISQTLKKFFHLTGLEDDCVRVSDDVEEYEDFFDIAYMIRFLFDAKQFVEDEVYRREVWDQVHFLDRKFKERTNESKPLPGAVSIFTFCPRDSNNYADDDELAKRIYELSRNKDYKGLFDLETPPKSEQLDNVIILGTTKDYRV